ncbi:MAG TPA: hypothetical protein EYP03_00385 [Aquificae bacterium]|nr:hypothetical protein [Aquificota bacterium]
MRKIFIILFLTFSSSYALETAGQIIFKDTLYGMGIGSIFGVASYLVDSSNFEKKIGLGILIGGSLGLVYGIFIDAKPFIAYQKSWKSKNIKLYTYVDYFNPNINLKLSWK